MVGDVLDVLPIVGSVWVVSGFVRCLGLVWGIDVLYVGCFD